MSAPSAEIAREVRRLAIPAILTSLLQTSIFVVDRIMLGNHSAAALAAMHLAGPLEWSVWSIFSAFSVATIAEVGNHVGAGNRDSAAAVARLSLVVGFVAGLVVVGLSPLVLLFLETMGKSASAATLNEARGYLHIVLFASPPIFVGMGALASLQAGGDTRTPLAIGLFVNVIHVALNRVLILGAFGIAGMGARGAGWSTAITFSMEAVLAVVVLLRGKGAVTIRSNEAMGVHARSLLRIGVPAFVERIVYQGGYVAFVAIVTLLGDAAMAANQALISVESICFLSGEGFGIAAAALVAQKLGAKKPSEAAGAARKSATYSVILLSSVGILFLLTRRWVLPIFSHDAHVIEVGLSAAPMFLVAQPFMAVGLVYGQALRGAGKTREVFWVSVISVGVLRVVATYVAAIVLGWGLLGVWIGSTCDWVLRSVLLVHLARRVGLTHGQR